MKNRSSAKDLEITIVGAGILGLTTAYVIRKLMPFANLNIIEAGPNPLLGNGPKSATFGQGKDARHFTGTESLSFQTEAISSALALPPRPAHDKQSGWQLLEEHELSEHEREWRETSHRHYREISGQNVNHYDDIHAQLNYAGMELWDWVCGDEPEFIKNCLSNDGVTVLFWSDENYQEDLVAELRFHNLYAGQKYFKPRQVELNSVMQQLVERGCLSKHSLQVPGSSWKVQSLARELLRRLEKNKQVSFEWNKKVEDELPSARNVIWASGTTYGTMNIQKSHVKIQGVAGCWVAFPNIGFKNSFKISLQQPGGYYNCTPLGDELLVSGGFGWSGHRDFEETEILMNPTTEIFIAQVSKCFGMNPLDFGKGKKYPIGICIRPSSPTGLPDVRVVESDKRKQVFLSGSSKSGSTQAVLLAMFASSMFDKKSTQDVINKLDNNIINRALEKVRDLSILHDGV